MKTFIQSVLMTLLIQICFAIAGAQTTSFTYQGKLNDNNLPANGTYQMEFGLYGAASGGSQIGGTQANAVTVTNGVFTVNLSFGAAAFDGTDRFLQIGVFSVATNAFVALNPRQQIMSAPYSVKSLTAATADTATNALNLGGMPANQFVVTSDPRMTDARPPTAGSNLYLQNTTNPQAADLYLTGEVGASSFDSNFGYSINGDPVLRAPGLDNYFVGYVAGGGTTTGTGNSFFGRTAGFANSTGNNNSLLGSNSNVGSGNLSFATAIGANAVVSTSNTVMLGRTGGQDTVQVPGILNVANQYNIGGNRVLSVAGTDNLFAGENSGTGNTTGSSNSFFGLNSGFNNTTGANNSFFGRGAGFGTTTGGDNSFFGRSAGFSNSTGTNNAFFGRSTGLANTIGTFNSFYGSLTGDSNTTGNNNTFVGAAAGSANTSGNANTFIGLQAGEDNSSGDNNVFVGVNAGITNTTGNNNTYIGTNAKGTPGISNATAIGANAVAGANNQIVLGTSGDNIIAQGGLYVDGLVSINTLGSPGTVPLCRNGLTHFISTCVATLGAANPESSIALQISVNEQKAQIQKLQEQIEMLKKLVCLTNAQTDVCKEVK
jgi:hypothetical protein